MILMSFRPELGRRGCDLISRREIGDLKDLIDRGEWSFVHFLISRACLEFLILKLPPLHHTLFVLCVPLFLFAYFFVSFFPYFFSMRWSFFHKTLFMKNLWGMGQSWFPAENCISSSRRQRIPMLDHLN